MQACLIEGICNLLYKVPTLEMWGIINNCKTAFYVFLNKWVSLSQSYFWHHLDAVEHSPHQSSVWFVDSSPSVFSWLVMEAHWNKVALHQSSQESWSLETRHQPVTREGIKKKLNILPANISYNLYQVNSGFSNWNKVAGGNQKEGGTHLLPVPWRQAGA